MGLGQSAGAVVPLVRTRTLAVLCLGFACATASSPSGDLGDDSADGSVSLVDARGPISAADAAPGSPDARPGTPDARVQGTPDAAVSSSFDPDLSLPDPSGASCDSPGNLAECPGIEVCRFYDENAGRCESCEPCGNLNASCTASDQCDILFMCYQGRCTNFCILGTFNCGPIEECINIGHPTQGVCLPN